MYVCMYVCMHMYVNMYLCMFFMYPDYALVGSASERLMLREALQKWINTIQYNTIYLYVAM